MTKAKKRQIESEAADEARFVEKNSDLFDLGECWNCGWAKYNPLGVCPNCGRFPLNPSQSRDIK